MKLFEKLEGLTYSIGKFTASKLESAVDLVPERARPKARKALEIAKREAKKAFDKSTATRQFLENLGYRMALNGMSKAVMFFLTLWLTRVLSPDEFGLYSFTISTTMLFAVFGDFGVNGAILKKVPEFLTKGEREKASGWVLGSLLVLSIGGLFIFGFLFLASPWLAAHVFNKPFTRGALKLAGGFIFIYLSAGFLDNLFISLKRNDLAFYASVLKEIIKIISIIGLTILFPTYITAVYGYMIGFLAFLLMSLLILVKEYPFLIEGNPVPIHEVIQYSKWFLVLGLTGTILSMTDIMMISAMLPIKYAGYYKIATSLVFTAMVLVPVASITLPFFASVRAKEKMEAMFKKVFKKLLVVSLGISILLVLFGGYLLNLLYPIQYAREAMVPLSVLAFLVPARNVFLLVSQRLVALGKENKQIILTLGAGVLNFTLNSLMIPAFGLVGAAVASVVSLLTMTVLGLTLSI